MNIRILTLENEDWGLQYEFVFDRLRAVRQDIVIQNVWNPEITFIYECIVRFHIYSIYKYCFYFCCFFFQKYEFCII